MPSETTTVVLADAGVKNVNSHVDALITTGVLRRVLAFTELQFWNSMIEAWWRSLKHHWRFLHSLDSVSTVRRLVEFYVQEHNGVFPIAHFADRRPTRRTSAAATRFQQTSRHAQSPYAGPALRPTDRSPAGSAHPSTRLPDHRQPTGPCGRVRLKARPGTRISPGRRRRTGKAVSGLSAAPRTRRAPDMKRTGARNSRMSVKIARRSVAASFRLLDTTGTTTSI